MRPSLIWCYIKCLLLFYNYWYLLYRNPGISSLLLTLVTVMFTLFCQLKNYMEHLQIMASVSRYCIFVKMPKLHKRSRSIDFEDVELILSSCIISLQSTKCSSARDLKLLCADDEQTRTCWITAMRLLKVGLLFTNSQWCLKGGMLSQC